MKQIMYDLKVSSSPIPCKKFWVLACYHVRCRLFKYPGALKCHPFRGSTVSSFMISVKKQLHENYIR